MGAVAMTTSEMEQRMILVRRELGSGPTVTAVMAEVVLELVRREIARELENGS